LAWLLFARSLQHVTPDNEMKSKINGNSSQRGKSNVFLMRNVSRDTV